MFATVLALRAVSCQLDELNGLLLQSKHDNAEFYRFAIQKMHQEIDVFNARALTAAAVRSSKASQSSQKKHLPSFLQVPKVGCKQDPLRAAFAADRIMRVCRFGVD